MRILREKSILMIALIACGVFCCVSAASAVGEDSDAPLLLTGESVKYDISPPLLLLAPGDYSPSYYRPLRKVSEGGRSAHPPKMYAVDSVLQDEFGPELMPSPVRNFEGLSNHDNLLITGFRALPPDPNGDVGLTHYVQMVNNSFAIFDKTGVRLYVGANKTLWTGFGGPCELARNTDPIVLYDWDADRWLMSTLALPELSSFGYQCLAVSVTGDPTGAWYRYAFKVSETKVNDYPKYGVWRDAYYMSANQFVDTQNGDLFQGSGVVAFERSKMLQGLEARFIYFDLSTVDPNLFGLLPSHLNGHMLPPAGTPNFFVGFFDDRNLASLSDQLNIWEFRVDWNVPSNSTFLKKNSLLTAAFDSTLCSFDENCIPQPGTTAKLDPISDRLMCRLQYRNFGSHQSMVVNHTVDTDGSDHAGIRWFELRNAGAGWFIRQQGTYAPDSDHRWMGSVAMDGNGNIVLGYSVSGNSTYPSVRYAGRLASDPLNTLPRGESSLIEGGGSQTHPASRWGDYSTMSIDPADDLTFWYTQEYYDVTSASGWKTRIGAFTFKTYSIFASANDGGSISPSGTVKVNHGAKQVFTIIPNPGYHVTDVLVDGSSIGAVTTFTFSDIGMNHTIEAFFSLTVNNCAASLSPGLDLGVPVVKFGGTHLEGDASCEPHFEDVLRCRLLSYQETDVSLFSNCEIAFLSADLKLYLPVVFYDGVSFWADLEYVPTSDGEVWFRLVAFGNN